MHFLNRKLNYATFAYYSSSFTRENLLDLIKPSFYINFPLFYAAIWLLLEGILENYPLEDSLVEIAGNIMSFLLILGVCLSLWLVPKNHLKIYRDIFKTSGLADYLPENFTFEPGKKIVVSIQYIIAQVFYTSASGCIFFIMIMLSFFIFFFILSIFFITAAITSNANFVILGFISFALTYVALYAMSFGFPCFLPITLLFHNSWRNRGFFARTAKLGMKYLKYVTLLFSLEALIKVFSLILFFLIISNLEHISLNLQDANIFDELPRLIEISFLKEKIKIFLVFIFWGAFNIIWDVFKAGFVSYLFVYHYKKDSSNEKKKSLSEDNSLVEM